MGMCNPVVALWQPILGAAGTVAQLWVALRQALQWIASHPFQADLGTTQHGTHLSLQLQW